MSQHALKGSVFFFLSWGWGLLEFFGSQCVPISSQWVLNMFLKLSIVPHLVPIFFAETLFSWKRVYRWANIGIKMFFCVKVFLWANQKGPLQKKFLNLEDTPNYFYFICSFQPNLAKCSNGFMPHQKNWKKWNSYTHEFIAHISMFHNKINMTCVP